MVKLGLDLALLTTGQWLSNVPQERRVHDGGGEVPHGVQHQGRLSNHEDSLYMNAISLKPFTPGVYS